MSVSTLERKPGQQVFPAGLNNAFVFAVFNALSFQIVLSSPMVLYAKGLGASATVLGIIAGMMPLLVVFQIPAVQYVNRIGYKRFVYAGWGMRVVFIFLMALVPLTSGFLSPATRVSLILLLMFCFSLSRGISSAAWLPWITTLVPPNVRGRYLALDAAYTNVASFMAFIVGAWCLGRDPAPSRFSLLFFFSAIMGATSLIFLKRIPDAQPPQEDRVSKAPVPWLEIVRYRPFRNLLWLAAVWSIAHGGMSAFTVAYLKVFAGVTEGRILLVTATAFLGGLCSLWFLGSRLDALGSKPVQTFSLAMWMLISAGWLCLSGEVFSARLLNVVVLQFLMGLFAALMGMATMRLAMAIIPPMGRNHFFAIFTVVTSVSLGLAPIGWGLLIDAVGGWQASWMGVTWNRYAVFFAATIPGMLLALFLARRMEEPEAVSMEALLRELLIQSPQRIWMRFWPRG